MTISVIVPIFKIEQFLPKCIESIIAQTYKDLEIILVDDGSPDRCPEICEQYSKRDPRIKVIHKENGGLVSARKAGLKASTGQLIGYVDGDDWIGPDFYENLYNAYCESKADVIIDGFSRDIEDVSERIENNIPTGIYGRSEMEKMIFPRMFCGGDYFYFGIYSYVWNKLFSRDVLFNNQMNVDERISVGEDIACAFPAIMQADSIHIINSCSYHYQQRAGSMLKSIEGYKTEVQKLDVLEDFLVNYFEMSDHKDILIPQLKSYMTGIRLMRTGIINDEDFFERNIKKTDKIAVYSAGTFGQNLVGQIKSKIGCEIVGWFDPDYRQYDVQGLHVQSPEVIGDYDFDYIIIASLDIRFIEKTVSFLTSNGVDINSIKTVKKAFEVK